MIATTYETEMLMLRLARSNGIERSDKVVAPPPLIDHPIASSPCHSRH
jgi:hypothetical protein